MIRKVLVVFVLFALAAAASFACGPNQMCMGNPQYASCASAAQNTKESCNNNAGPFCSNLCGENGTCTANCWTMEFSNCQTTYCSDMSMCEEQICYQQ